MLGEDTSVVVEGSLFLIKRMAILFVCFSSDITSNVLNSKVRFGLRVIPELQASP